MVKRCVTCKKRKQLSSFNKHKDQAYGVQDRCRACFKTWYSQNATEHKKNVSRNKRERIDAKRERVIEYLRSHPCIDCGETDIIVLDFDHMFGKKTATISAMVIQDYSWTAIRKEIEKCVVRCANDHRRKTAKQLNFYKSIYGS